MLTKTFVEQLKCLDARPVTFCNDYG